MKRAIIILLLMCVTGLGYAQLTSGKSQIGLFGSTTKMVGGDMDNSMISPWYGMNMGYTFSPKLGINLEWASGWDKAFDSSKDNIGKYFKSMPNTPYRLYLFPLLLNLKYNLLPEKPINPYLTLGGGLLFWDLRDVSNDDSIIPFSTKGAEVSGSETTPMLNIGFGTDFFVTENFAFDLRLQYQQLIGQNKDMSGFGDKQSGNIEARAGFNIFFGGWKDTDDDGIEDKFDRCVTQAEDYDGFQDLDGCPDPDNDQDGVPDVNDRCPNQPEDMDGFEDNDGCPDPDNDQDGIPDIKDKCPNQPEDMDGFADNDGCPDMDNDNDGIPDTLDKCPDEAETDNGYEDSDGCPDKKPEVMLETRAPIVLQGISFASGSSELTPLAKSLLDAVYRTLIDYPEMEIQVSGHTDNIGKRESNVKLSRERAESVKAYLIYKGINSLRIQAVGFGPDIPIANNNTVEGRAMNRRIEFIRIK